MTANSRVPVLDSTLRERELIIGMLLDGFVVCQRDATGAKIEYAVLFKPPSKGEAFHASAIMPLYVVEDLLTEEGLIEVPFETDFMGARLFVVHQDRFSSSQRDLRDA